MIVYENGEHEYLDYAALSEQGDYVDIDRVMIYMPVTDLYFERSKSIRLVWNYVCDIGVRSTLRKIVSRSAERNRNKKFLLVGTGRIYGGENHSRGVMFVAPRHPAYPSRLWLSKNCYTNAPLDSDSCVLEVLEITHVPAAHQSHMEALAGWDPFSEEKPESVDWAVVNEILQGASTKARYKKNSSDVITQTTAGNNTFNGVRTATLFGLGNYAKTILIPSLPKGISISRIHEIDPLQITGDKSYEWDTSPVLSSNDNNDIVFIAGYHHTHNELACSAITAGKFAVVEKPLVVNRHQLATLEKAFDVGNGSYFACFHKRYSLFNEDALSDLRAEAYQTAINYHCIVYEVPLPAKHWYRWKSSSSRIISNGCHWIDHFIYLNDFSKPIRIQCSEASNGTISVFMELENGACFTMTLTDVGSEKIGVQDHIELRCNDVTVKITNGSRYIAESKDRTLRKKKINKIASYRNMYASISRSILSNIPGDSWEHTKISSEAILSVNEMLGGRQ